MKPVICLMGPTASSKTDVAISLCKRFPLDIISVDSALVYRGMNIGTAKPDDETLKRAPHRLINIRDPEETYSAGDFVSDARAEIDGIHSAGRVPILVGGTMMYFRSLTAGIAQLPPADTEIRASIDEDAEKYGWPAMHERLRAVDPKAADRIKSNDRQRIQRALEVHMASGRALSDWQSAGSSSPDSELEFVKIALQPVSRKVLHERIENRLNLMINNGFVDEVKVLYERPELTAEHASMRSVGYRQLWQHLDGLISFEEAEKRALYATRQLAKRQITWLRSESGLRSFDPLEAVTIDAISASLIEFFDA